MITIRVLDFTEFPGPRHETLGVYSGERFREEHLLPAIRKYPISEITINLDGTAGYGSSFLEEAFGGLIRAGVSVPDAMSLCDNLISEEDPSLIAEIKGYVFDEAQKRAS